MPRSASRPHPTPGGSRAERIRRLAVTALIVSGASASAAQASTVTLRPTADTQVAARHSRSLGHARALHADASDRILLRFDASKVSDPIEHASLLVFASAKKTAPFKVSAVKPGRRWSEKSVGKRPPASGATLDAAKVNGSKWIDLDVTKAAKAGVVELVLSSPARSGVTVRSRETGSAPRLVLTTSPPPPVHSQPPPSAAPVPQTTPTPAPPPHQNALPSLLAPANQTGAEGAATSFALGSFTDTDSSSWTAVIDWGDAHSTNLLAAIPGSLPATTHTYADDGSYTVKVTVTDNDGGSALKTFSVTVADVAPAVTAASGQSADEGTGKALSLGSFTDPGADTWTADIDWGDSHTSSFTATPGPLPATTHSYTDNGTYTVRVTVTDGDGGASDTKTFAVTVANLAPTATLGNDGPVAEGSPAHVTFTNPGDASSADTAAGLHYAFRCDGTPFPSDPTYAGAATAPSTTCTFDDDGSHTVRARVLDKDGGATEYTTPVSVTNVKPTVTAPGSQTAVEGTATMLSLGSFTDPGADTWTADIDWGDLHGSSFAATRGALPATAHTYADNGTYTVKVTITDDEGAGDTKSFTVTVGNVAPTATLGNDGPVAEGSPAHVSFTGQADASSADTAAGLRYAFRCDGTPFATDPTYAAAGTAAGTTCTFADDGSHTVRARILDKDGGSTEYTTHVSVTNIAPHVTAPGAQAAGEGTAKSFALGSFSDPGDADTWTAVIDWGDGHTSGPAAVTRGTLPATDHTFADDGAYTVKVTVTDDDGGSAFTTFPVTVDNVAPTVHMSGPTGADEGSTQSYTFTIADPGADTIKSVLTSCGSGGQKVGGSDTHTSTSGGFQCSFADGPADPTVSAAATDSDDATGTPDTKAVHVSNLAPTATLGNDGPVAAGDAVHIAFGDQADASVADAAALRYAVRCDGTPFPSAPDYAGASTAATMPCTFPDTGTHSVLGRILDKDGGFTEYATNVTVNPADPAAVYLSPAGSDAAPCTKAAPCLTFQRGYRAASAGDVVQLAAGSYDAQEVTKDPSKTGTDPVVIRPASGATVHVARVSVAGASHLTLAHLDVLGAVGVENTHPDVLGSEFVTFDHATAKTLTVVGRVAHISAIGGSYGDTVDNQPQIKKYNLGDDDAARPRDITIDGAFFHDFRASAPGVHTECLQVMQVDTLVVRNSRFDDCDGTGDLALTHGPSDDVTIENNFLGKAGDAVFAAQITKNVRNLVLRNNSAAKAVVFSDTMAGGPYLVESNYMPYDATTCTAGATYRHNVLAGGRCSPDDVKVAAMHFADEDGFDLHLAPNSEAIDRGDPGDFPGHDIDGEARPMGVAPDAGADEHDASGDPEPPSTVFLDPAGADANPCTKAAPCRTFQRGYEAAPNGGTVELGDGGYPAQALTTDDTKSGPDPVVIRPAAGASPVIQTLDIEGASHVTVRDLDFLGGVHVENSNPDVPGSRFVAFDGLTAERFTIIGRVSDITVKDGSYGDALDSTPVIKKYNPADDADEARPRDITIDGASFHDYRQSPGEGDTACLRVTSVDTLTIRRSRFNHCDGAGDIDLAPGSRDHVTLENNFLGGVGAGDYAAQISAGVRDLSLRYNSASAPIIFTGTADGGPYALVGNYLPFVDDTCVAGGTFRNNVFAGGTCGPTDWFANEMQFADAANFDLHLAAASEAKGKGDPADFPATDIDGQTRPLGDLPDAGADEAE